MKIHNRISRARTGQTPSLVGYGPDGTPIYSTPQGAYSRNGNGGACAPQATVLKSHGAGCPPAGCDLATGLGRQYADAGACRELTYWVRVDNGFNDSNATVTMCPTRIIAVETNPTFGATLSSLVFGNQNQMIGDPIPLLAMAPDAVQMIPWVTHCIKSGQKLSIGLSGVSAEPDAATWIGFVGPMIG